MPIPPERGPGDTGHIGDHNDISGVLTEHEGSLGTLVEELDSHRNGADPHGDRAYADANKAPLNHTHTPASLGAETPSGAQAKVDTLAATVVPLSQKGASNGVATLDGTGKIPSGQLPSGSGVTSVNGESGAVTLTADDVGAVAVTARGAANGVASLDVSTLVPVAQIPSLDAAKIGSGTFPVSRIPTGITSSTVSLGDHTHTFPVTSVNSQTGAVVLSATDVGALATSARGAALGVASLDASVLVPVAQIPDLDAGKIVSGTLGTGRIPDLSASYVTTGPNNNPQIASNATTRGFARVDLNYTTTGGTPDAMAFYYGGSGGSGGVRTGYHNEYGELRARPATQSTVAFRAMGHGSGSTGNIFEVANQDSSAIRLGVSETAAAFSVPVSVTGAVTATGAVTGSNLPPSISSGSTLPSPAGFSEGAVFLLLP